MGKCISKRGDLKFRRPEFKDYIFNYVTDRQQLTQQEKCDFISAIRDDPEVKVIKQVKENPSLLSCMFWFEYYRLETVEKTDSCTCSCNLELCYKENIPTYEMVKRLELAITTTKCAHMALHKTKRNITTDKDISSAEVLEICDVTIPSRVLRNNRKTTAGVYWIHLAVVYNKMEVIKQLLPFALECGAFDVYHKTIRHNFSPIYIALMQQNTGMAEFLAAADPALLYFSPLHVDRIYPILQDPLSLSLHHGQFKTFRKFYEITKSFERGWFMSTGLRNSSYVRQWPERIVGFFQEDNMEAVSTLLSIEKLELYVYLRLFQIIFEKGTYWMCDKILAESDFSQQMSKATEYYIKKFDEVLIKAVFSNKPHAVKLFIDNGLNKNALYKNCSALTWAEYLEFMDVAVVLRSANAGRKIRQGKYSLLYLIVDYQRDIAFIYDFEPLPLVHRIFKIKRDTDEIVLSLTDTLSVSWRNFQHGVFHYLLLQGADPSYIIDKIYGSRYFDRTNSLLYHIIATNTFINCEKLFLLFHQLDSRLLYCIDEVADPSFTYSIMDVAQHISTDFPKFFELWTDWYEPVRPLTYLCRRALRKRYKCYQYFQFLATKIDILPKSTIDFLMMTDLLEPLFPVTELSAHYTDIILARRLLNLNPYLFENLSPF